MIWFRGGWVQEPMQSVTFLDRTFEHGLGLFETLRTWSGKARLLSRHLERMQRSASALGLHITPNSLPDARVIQTLIDQEHGGRDAVVRITLTGGISTEHGSELWLQARPLPEPMGRDGGLTLWPCDSPISPFDALARHKTLNYWSRRMVHEQATARGADEALLLMPTPRGPVGIEGSRTNLFLVVGDRLITVAEDAPILPGILRGLAIELAGPLGIQVEQVGWEAVKEHPELLNLDRADEVFLTNSVRGILPVGLVGTSRFPSPGAWTRRLQAAVDAWLREDQE